MGWAHPARTLEHPSKPVLCLVVEQGKRMRVTARVQSEPDPGSAQPTASSLRLPLRLGN